MPGDPTMEWRIRCADPLERDGDGGAREPQAGRARRPHRQLRFVGDAVRRRLQSFLARAERRPSGRPDFPSGPFQPGHLCALVPRRPHRAEDQLDLFRMEVAGKGRGAVVVSASVADAGLLAGADGVDGPRARSRRSTRRTFWKYLENRGLMPKTDRKVWCFLGDGETDEPESLGAISLAGREELDNLIFVDQLQPAAPRRPGARQRQDHPGTRRRVPRRRLERDQGGLGQLLGSAAGAGHATACCAS